MALRDHPQHVGAVGFWDKQIGVNDSRGFFAISGVIANPQSVVQEKDGLFRCDSGRLGPYGFHRWDSALSQCSCGLNVAPEPAMGHHHITLDKLSCVSVVFDALPHGFILYFELHDPLLEEECIRMPHSDCARTLQEILRLLVEWDFAYTELGNRELIAQTCHSMLQTMNMPVSVHDFLLSQMPDEKVAAFIKGNPNAQNRAPVNYIPGLSEEIDSWLEYMILSSKPLGAYVAG